MSCLSKRFFVVLRTAICVVLMFVIRAPAQSTPGANESADMFKRVQQLELQVQQLKSAIAALEAGNAAPAATTTPAAPEVGTLPQSNKIVGTLPAETEPSALSTVLGSTTISGFVDMYYGKNFNNPATLTDGLRFFDAATNQFGLNLIELVVDKTPDPSNSRTGYRIALGYGQAMSAITGAGLSNSFSADQYVKEAYFSYLAPVGKGVQFDFGKFVTPAGFEVIETKDNYNYSRGVLFSYAIPYYHFGMRAKYAFNDRYSLTGFFVNGWNNTIDNNTGRTYGLSFGWNPTKKVSIVQNYLAGREQNDPNHDWRHLFDTVVSYSATKRLTLAANYDYGRGDHMDGMAEPVYWTGIAGYAKYGFTDKYSIATRYEYYRDHYGFTTGTPGHIQEVTGTLEHPIATHILGRLEFRRDMANNPIFLKGTSSPVREQNTLAAGMVFVFESREEAK